MKNGFTVIEFIVIIVIISIFAVVGIAVFEGYKATLNKIIIAEENLKQDTVEYIPELTKEEIIAIRALLKKDTSTSSFGW